MNLKPRKTPTTYVPKRAHRGHGVTAKQELDLRRMAGLVKNQEALNAMMLQVGVGRPPHEQEELRRRGYSRISPYVPFQAKPFDEINLSVASISAQE